MKPMDHLALLINRYPVLEPVKEAIFQAYCLLEKCYEGGGKLLIGGKRRKQCGQRAYRRRADERFLQKKAGAGGLCRKTYGSR